MKVDVCEGGFIDGILESPKTGGGSPKFGLPRRSGSEGSQDFGRVAAEILTIFGGEECKKPKFSRACGARIPYTVKKSLCVYQL